MKFLPQPHGLYATIQAPYKGFDMNTLPAVQELRANGYHCVGVIGASDDRLNITMLFEAPDLPAPAEAPNWSFLGAAIIGQAVVIVSAIVAAMQWL